jgi:adenine-specific DNA-methyltransferase
MEELDPAILLFLRGMARKGEPPSRRKGKDEQDPEPLEVPAVPIHVQEKIHP